MKRSEPELVGDLLRMMVESEGNGEIYLREKASFLWSEVVGPSITRMTLKRFMSGNDLHVFITSGPVKSELAFMVNGIAERINLALGKKVIHRIIIH
ncbi:MAG: DUF721 domain-containing protein [Muribaculaceae bacterium]|nr:DUF721 domain-containing protein [Muribaculaceae bacterium]